MSEQKPERKVVGRTVAIALGIICIILAAFLVGAVADYTSIISGKDNTIMTDNAQIQTLTNQKNQYKTWLNGNETLLNQTETWLNANITLYNNYVANHHHSDSDYNLLTTQITNLQNQVSHLQSEVTNLTDIVDLANSTVWVNDKTVHQAASSTTVWTFSASYAGYISVNVQFSTTNNTYVHINWVGYGVTYSNWVIVGTNGTAVSLVLPTSLITIIVGNSNPTNEAVETVTITYYY